MTIDDIWFLEMASKGIKINLACFIMNKMFLALKEKEKEAKGKQKSSQQLRVSVSYVTFITHYAKSLGTLSLEYEMIPFAIKYNLASIAKMGYKDHNNDGKFVKV